MASDTDRDRIDPETYRLACSELKESWSGEDQKWLRVFLSEVRGMKVMQQLILREQEALKAPAGMDLTKEEGVKQAIRAQGRATGLVQAIEEIISLANGD